VSVTIYVPNKPIYIHQQDGLDIDMTAAKCAIMDIQINSVALLVRQRSGVGLVTHEIEGEYRSTLDYGVDYTLGEYRFVFSEYKDIVTIWIDEGIEDCGHIRSRPTYMPCTTKNMITWKELFDYTVVHELCHCLVAENNEVVTDAMAISYLRKHTPWHPFAKSSKIFKRTREALAKGGYRGF